MSSSSILSLGFGSFSDINHVVTLGYVGIGLAETAPPPPVEGVEVALIPQRPPTDFVLTGDGVYGRPRINGRDLWLRRVVRNNGGDIQEMRQMYEAWRQAA